MRRFAQVTSFAAAVRALGLDPALPRIAPAIGATLGATLGALPPDLRDAEAARLALGVVRHFRIAPLGRVGGRSHPGAGMRAAPITASPTGP